MTLRLVLLAALGLLPFQAAADTLIHVQIDTPDAPAVAEALQREGFDVLEGSIREESLEVIASSAELALLKEQGYQFVILATGRPFREIQGEWDVPPGYPDLAEIEAELYATAAAFPAICQAVDLTATYGAPPTYEGRHLYAVKISDNVSEDEDEPVFLLVSTHHAREIVTPVIALHAIEQFTTLYGSHPQITALVNEYEIWVAPVWNPDGYNWVFVGDDMWRKNRRVFPEGIGVDLNRNYPFGWYSSCSGSSNVWSSTYKGPEPASEAETQTMIAWSNDRLFTKLIDYHSSGREVLYAYACLDHPFESWLHSEAIAISNASGYGGDTRPPSAEGEHFEWQLAAKGVYAFLEETHTSFQPSYASALAEAAMVFPGVLWMLERPVPLSGHVTDATSGAPLEACIELVGVNFQNDEANGSNSRFGRYHVFPPPGNYTVQFSAPDYVSQSFPVTVTGNSAEVLDVALVREWLLGDLNCDGEVDFGDVNPFVLALVNLPLYEATYPGCPFENRDINGDAEFDFGDINPFTALLTGSP